jgi:hypothetical protein
MAFDPSTLHDAQAVSAFTVVPTVPPAAVPRETGAHDLPIGPVEITM